MHIDEIMKILYNIITNLRKESFFMDDEKSVAGIDEIDKIVDEVKDATEENLRNVIERHFNDIKTSSMKIGAQYICLGVFDAIKRNTGKGKKPSLRDYERCVTEITKIISVPIATLIAKESEDKN